jgi:hypothetical protein
MRAEIYNYNSPQLLMQNLMLLFFLNKLMLLLMLQCTDYNVISVLGLAAIRGWKPIYKQ